MSVVLCVFLCLNVVIGDAIKIVGQRENVEYQNYPRDEIVSLKQNDKFLQHVNDVSLFGPYDGHLLLTGTGYMSFGDPIKATK